MTGRTHRSCAVLCTLAGVTYLKKCGIDLNANLLVEMTLMYPFARWGCVAPDLDQSPDYIPSKTLPSRIINQLLNAFHAKHRSWQTHSDMTAALCVLLLLYGKYISRFKIFSYVDMQLLFLITVGIIIGILAHLLLDMLTPSGIWCTSTSVLNAFINALAGKKKNPLPAKIHLVPKLKWFSTGKGWDTVVRIILNIASLIIIIMLMLSKFFPTQWNWLMQKI